MSAFILINVFPIHLTLRGAIFTIYLRITISYRIWSLWIIAGTTNPQIFTNPRHLIGNLIFHRQISQQQQFHLIFKPGPPFQRILVFVIAGPGVFGFYHSRGAGFLFLLEGPPLSFLLRSFLFFARSRVCVCYRFLFIHLCVCLHTPVRFKSLRDLNLSFTSANDSVICGLRATNHSIISRMFSELILLLATLKEGLVHQRPFIWRVRAQERWIWNLLAGRRGFWSLKRWFLRGL